ncbi:MAG: DEAD/DEAH box helicase [Gemmataceae bacterium]
MSGSTFRHLDAPRPARDVLALLAPPLARWFTATLGEPTEVQRLAWPALSRREHLLLSAPTGTGKTLAALVPLLGPLFAPFEPATWSTSPLRVLYVAPLKALVNDAARALTRHLEELHAMFPGATLPRVGLRTGDVPAAERRRLHHDPPDVLLTTPESLAVLLAQPWSSGLFANLGDVVVDEVHALAGNKRGADLALSLERLTQLCPGLRRIGLSATATPLETAARWLVGVERDCAIVSVPTGPEPVLDLEPLPEGAAFLGALLDRLAVEVPRQRATLVFTNTRSLAERVAWGLRRRLPHWDRLIAAHHSSLAPARREEIESRFKRGELRAVVCSTSLELGIDVGTVDLAILVHPPGDVVRLLQRIGRAGHDPGGLRRGLLLTAGAGELLEAAVTCLSGRAGQTEPLALADHPLDVLAQQLAGMCCARSCDPVELFDLVRRSTPFADLTRRDFDDVLAYLRGLDQRGEPWLPARLTEDGDCFRVLDRRTARLLLRNLGTILSETSISVRRRDGDELDEVGEVDESFADRLQPGDRFLLDGRSLEYRGREDGAAVVVEVAGRPQTPRWLSGGWPLSPQLARRLYLLRLRAAEALRESPTSLAQLLGEEYGLHGVALQMLASYFEEQESVSEIPDAATLLVEVLRHDGGTEYHLHTPLNRLGNDALGRVLVRRLTRDHGRAVTLEVADLGLVLRLRGELTSAADTLRTLLDPTGFATELDGALAESEALRTRFARVAQTGLMLLRQPEGKQRKVGGSDWAQRRLFEQIRAHDDDFVFLRQALHEVRQELCDVTSALEYLRHLPAITIRCRVLARPSPFARSWTQAATEEADPVRSAAEALAALHAELMGGGRAGGA